MHILFGLAAGDVPVNAWSLLCRAVGQPLREAALSIRAVVSAMP